ncbi:HipA family kinase [Rhizobium rosettiformans]|uniref:HipA family kinase n=1 Tax=Rhizobium rosettiformans TaxID=1368430 RepID=UPI00286B2C42|nr:HipA family kinase [Rhizobium rosettiformans]
MGGNVLACGSLVCPTEITREIQHFTSSTSPARVATDAGDGFIKSLGNPMGSAALVSELVAAELAVWFQLNVPPFALVRNCDIEIIMRKNGLPMEPPLFFSSAVDGIPRDGSDVFLRRLRDREAVSRLVVFDTWIRNWDRYYGGEANSDNLLYVQASAHKYDLVPIDHSNCFIGSQTNFPEGAAPAHWIEDGGVYGKFPEFDDFITSDGVKAALAKLATVERDFVVEVVNSVPIEWGLGYSARAGLVDFICARATYVVDTLAPKLIDEPPFPGF